MIKETSKEKESINMTNFVELTRVYKVSETGEIKTQPIRVARFQVVSIRPSNRLGKANHRSTIITADGREFDLAEKYSEVSALIA